MSTPSEYWINLTDPEQLGPAIKQRFDWYLDDLEESGRMGDLRLALRRYYGGDHGSGARSTDASPGGEQGETTDMTINQFRSLLITVLSLTTATRPAFLGVAADDTSEAMAAVQLAEQLWDDALVNAGLEAEWVDAVRRMLIMQEAGVFVGWDPNAGEVVGQDRIPEVDEHGRPVMEDPAEEMAEGERPHDESGPELRMREVPIYKGELICEALSPHNIARDVRARSLRDPAWLIVRRPFSKWELLAQYPDHEAAILGVATVDKDDHEKGLAKGVSQGKESRTDQVYVLELYAKRTMAVPDGRYARVIGEGTLLESGPLPYERIPVVLSSPEQMVDRALGASNTIDLLGPQEAYDGIISNLVSISAVFGRPNLLDADGQETDIEAVKSGFGVVGYKPVEGAPPPGPMERPRIDKAELELADAIKGVMQTLIGANDVVRGDPQESLKSGAALALVQAMAIQHNSLLARAAAYLLDEMASRVIETYRSNATVPRIIEASGTLETKTVKAFLGDDLNRVAAVRVQLANPLLRTTAGKKEIADFYSDPQRWANEPPLTRAQHMTFMASGRLDEIMRAGRSEELAIREECEALAEGQGALVVVTDNHPAHIREHKALLDGRRRQELPPGTVEAITMHIMEHETQWQMLTMQRPALLAALGLPPAPMPMPMMPPGPMGPDGPPPPGGDMGDAEVEAVQPPSVGPAAVPDQPGGSMPSGPQMPVNPATGERVAAPGGVIQ